MGEREMFMGDGWWLLRVGVGMLLLVTYDEMMIIKGLFHDDEF